MVLEMLLFNSIKRPIVRSPSPVPGRISLTVSQALGTHFLGLMFNSGLYLAWAAVGKALTGLLPFFWLDAAEVGSKEAVTAYCMGFVLLAPASESQSALFVRVAGWLTGSSVYTMMLGFVGIRQGLTETRSGPDAQEELEN